MTTDPHTFLAPSRCIICSTCYAAKAPVPLAIATEQIQILLTLPDRQNERRRFGNLACMQQGIEGIIGALKGQIALEDDEPPTRKVSDHSSCDSGNA